VHRRHTGGLESVEIAGRTVGECLIDLVGKFPGMRGALFDGSGNLKREIEIFLNAESTYPDELKKEVRTGDEIYIIVMLSGG
jgi:molybdopterin synthase sulfur carrier subunit